MPVGLTLKPESNKACIASFGNNLVAKSISLTGSSFNQSLTAPPTIIVLSEPPNTFKIS